MLKATKITKTQLMHILGVSYPTALKEYQIIIDSLQLKRNYLTENDLKNNLSYSFRNRLSIENKKDSNKKSNFIIFYSHSLIARIMVSF